MIIAILGSCKAEPPSTSLAAPNSHVLKTHGAKSHGVEQVLRIHDHRLLEETLDFLKVERAKFGPSRTDDQRIDAFGRAIGRFTVLHRAIELGLRFGKGRRVVGSNPCTFRDESLC